MTQEDYCNIVKEAIKLQGENEGLRLGQAMTIVGKFDWPELFVTTDDTHAFDLLYSKVTE